MYRCGRVDRPWLQGCVGEVGLIGLGYQGL